MDFGVFDDADYDESIKSKIENFARASISRYAEKSSLNDYLLIIDHFHLMPENYFFTREYYGINFFVIYFCQQKLFVH